MEENKRTKLLKELMEVESSDGEVEQLLSLAKSLSGFKRINHTTSFKNKCIKNIISKEVQKKTFWYSLLYTPVMAALLITILILVAGVSVVNAQSSIPGDLFYPLKRLSENVVLSVKPDFKDEIITRRSKEIERISKDKNDKKLLKATIDNYKKDLEENTDKKMNSKKIEETKENLNNAKENLSDEEKTQIDELITKIENRGKGVQDNNDKNDLRSTSSGEIKSQDKKSEDK